MPFECCNQFFNLILVPLQLEMVSWPEGYAIVCCRPISRERTAKKKKKMMTTVISSSILSCHVQQLLCHARFHCTVRAPISSFIQSVTIFFWFCSLTLSDKRFEIDSSSRTSRGYKRANRDGREWLEASRRLKAMRQKRLWHNTDTHTVTFFFLSLSILSISFCGFPLSFFPPFSFFFYLVYCEPKKKKTGYLVHVLFLLFHFVRDGFLKKYFYVLGCPHAMHSLIVGLCILPSGEVGWLQDEMNAFRVRTEWERRTTSFFFSSLCCFVFCAFWGRLHGSKTMRIAKEKQSWLIVMVDGHRWLEKLGRNAKLQESASGRWDPNDMLLLPPHAKIIRF